MVAIEIKGCPKRIHFVQVSHLIPHPRYGDKVPYFGTVRESDPDCLCRKKIREEMRRER